MWKVVTIAGGKVARGLDGNGLELQSRHSKTSFNRVFGVEISLGDCTQEVGKNRLIASSSLSRVNGLVTYPSARISLAIALPGSVSTAVSITTGISLVILFVLMIWQATLPP